jgi:hypothetical protein
MLGASLREEDIDSILDYPKSSDDDIHWVVPTNTNFLRSEINIKLIIEE